MKKFSLIVVLGISLGIAFGHEFWLQPSRFFATVGDKINVQILVGEGFLGERSEGRKNRISQFRHDAAGSITDLAPSLTGDAYSDISVPLTTAGTHLFSFANTPKFLSMKADSFLLYLEEDGLNDVIKARQKQGQTGKPSRELYQRCVKTLVQVGSPIVGVKADNTFARNTGMVLEIIPVQNPYLQHAGQTVDFQILFANKPLAGALVRYWNRNSTKRLLHEKQRSDKNGHVRFKLRSGGNMVSLVCMVPNETPTDADWHSYWGSLTFGCW